jgi:glycosyltransferase involved in cell wall biosynthesis
VEGCPQGGVVISEPCRLDIAHAGIPPPRPPRQASPATPPGEGNGLSLFRYGMSLPALRILRTACRPLEFFPFRPQRGKYLLSHKLSFRPHTGRVSTMSALSELFVLEKTGRHQKALERLRQHRCGAPGFTPISPFNLDLLEKRLCTRLFGCSKAKQEHGPKLSIIMPVFNVAPYLDTCFLSIRYQTFKDFELIVVDDASTDNSREIICMHAKLDSRIRVISLKSNTLGGAGIPSNVGLRAATGEYIGFVDSDDWISETAFKNLVAAAERHQADIVIGNFRTFVEQTHAYSEAYDLPEFENLPLDEVFTARRHPRVFRLSPVPWRKIYRRNFLEKYAISYPEVDYFYEDNPLHWFVLAAHSKLVRIDKIIAYHRMEREGQTMSHSNHRLAAISSHVNTIGRFLANHVELPRDQAIIDEFYDYLYRSHWIIERQEREDIKAILGKRLAKTAEKYQAKIPPKNIRKNFHNRMREYSAAYQTYDLTIVIPAFNCKTFIEETIDSVMNISGLSVNVLVMDDGSQDGTAEICQKLSGQHENLHFFQQKNRGAGRARNALIPLSTGLYTFFLNADDYIDSEAMVRSFKEAKKQDNDLYFMKYRIEFYEKKELRGMFNNDQLLWKQFRQAKDQNERRLVAASLINYPWNRLIKTEFLQDANIFFGPSIVHNDIAFHWESLLAANKIGYGEDFVCTHRKFEHRMQITNIFDDRRLEIFNALEYTHRRISQHANGPCLEEIWNGFVHSLLGWLKERLPEELHPQYEARKALFFNTQLEKPESNLPCMTI